MNSRNDLPPDPPAIAPRRSTAALAVEEDSGIHAAIDAALDEALDETFPASDPVAVHGPDAG